MRFFCIQRGFQCSICKLPKFVKPIILAMPLLELLVSRSHSVDTQFAERPIHLLGNNIQVHIELGE